MGGRNRFQMVLDNLHDGLYELSKDHKIIYWNKSAELISGYSAEEVLGKECSANILMHIDKAGNRLCNGLCPMKATLADGKMRQADVFLHHKDGHRVPVQVRTAPVYDDQGRIVSAVEIFFDNSSQLELERENENLRKMALLDPLTQVGNRWYAEAMLESLFSEAKRFSWPFGVLFLDIDRFKIFNDIHGHDTGDKVLKMVARSLKHGLRSYDVLSRWGGEEFLAVVKNVDQPELANVAEKLRHLVENSELPNDCNCLRVTVSIGGQIADPNDTPHSIIQKADNKMYESKRAGRNRITV